MKTELNKNTIAGTLSALSKLVCRTSPAEAHRCIQIEAKDQVLHLRTASDKESIEYRMEAPPMEDFSVVVPFEQFRTAVRGSRNKSIELTMEDNCLYIDGLQMNAVECVYPDRMAVPQDGVRWEALPDNFVELLNAAAPVVNREDYRKQLQGINLSRDGITATNGKELFNVPVKLEVESLTIPFPMVLLATKGEGAGRLAYWTDGSDVNFCIEVGNWSWTGKAVAGSYPNWKLIIPDSKYLTHKVEFQQESVDQLKLFLKSLPADPPNNGAALSRKGSDTLCVRSLKDGLELNVKAEFSGDWSNYVLTVNRDLLLRLLNEGHTLMECSEERGPFLATGGVGRYIAMPLYQAKQAHSEAEQTTKVEPEQEKNKVIDTVTNAVPVPQAVAPNQEPVNNDQLNPLEDLSASIEIFKGKLKLMFEESNVLSRKVKEVALSQKQKERDFILAKRAIERIRMAI